MTIFKDVLAELVGMFIGDARLSVAILAIVAAAATARRTYVIHPLAGGIILLVGCLLLVIAVVYLTARRHWAVQSGRVPADRTGAFQAAVLWLQRRRQRKALGELDGHLLDDIGVSKEAAEIESRRLD